MLIQKLLDQKKKTRGRQKIVIKKIERENDCYATFSKRRQGLFKKGSELSTLCDADVGIFIFSPTGKPFSFFHPSMEAVVSRFLRSSDDGDASRLVEAYSRTRVLQLNQMLEKVGGELHGEEERERELDGVVRREEEDVGRLEKEEVEELIGLVRILQVKLSNQRQKMVKED